MLLLSCPSPRSSGWLFIPLTNQNPCPTCTFRALTRTANPVLSSDRTAPKGLGIGLPERQAQAGPCFQPVTQFKLERAMEDIRGKQRALKQKEELKLVGGQSVPQG